MREIYSEEGFKRKGAATIMAAAAPRCGQTSRETAPASPRERARALRAATAVSPNGAPCKEGGANLELRAASGFLVAVPAHANGGICEHNVSCVDRVGATMIEDEELTGRWKRKLRREFRQLGRESVRYKLQAGGYGMAQRREVALQWLREQEAANDNIKRWTLDAAVVAAAVAVITLLVVLGVIK